ncbi:SDR family NAD(P)-dependent oxidoreductase [Oceanospirillum linum]|nr:SDR family NAD(P)-dependent oxidoreductase [Oceanospirillum linum]SEF78189.1 Short-chain dehydrogenase [Oleiphilus messinensis]SMP18001.1 Short-chain dehydrogenase [Oceanospirillum linum]
MSQELIWITGASQGIGKALALAYARAGKTVAISARHSENLQSVAAEAASLTGRILVLPCDVTDKNQVISSLNQLIEQERLPDRIILNAGTHQAMSARTFSADTIAKLLKINTLGSAIPLEVLLPHYLKQGSGQIAIVASVAGYRGLPTASAYGASKAALINLAESLRSELYSSGVDIRLVNPGFVKTPLTDKNEFDMPFLISAEKAASTIIRGLSGKRFEIVFPTPMAIAMSVLKWLPDRIFFPLINRGTGHGR